MPLHNNLIEPIMVEGQSIIDYYVTTPASNMLVRLLMPILVDLAQNHLAPITYGQLSALINHRTPRIGYQLGCIIDILEQLSARIGEHIPSLTGLCVLQSTGLPGGSIDRVISGYLYMTDQEKRLAVSELNQEAYNYTQWDRVLAYLGL